MDNQISAIEDYKMALKLDVYCNESFELLVRHKMLTPEEGKRFKNFQTDWVVYAFLSTENYLVEHLPFDEQCTALVALSMSSHQLEPISKLKMLYIGRTWWSKDQYLLDATNEEDVKWARGICEQSDVRDPYLTSIALDCVYMIRW